VLVLCLAFRHRKVQLYYTTVARVLAREYVPIVQLCTTYLQLVVLYVSITVHVCM
jgi:hypothetical protein